MRGVHDPLLTLALFIDNGSRQIVFCSVDHLGFTYEMVQRVTQKVRAHPGLKACEIYIGSSHTHSGGGAYLNVPVLGVTLAGTYCAEIGELYVNRTYEAIMQAYESKTDAKVGIGYGEAKDLSRYRSSWPKEISPLGDVTVIKVTHLDGRPLAVLFNYPVHPTVLLSKNRLFSADFVGYAREHLRSALAADVQALYFNGAQGDIDPVILNEEDRFKACDQMAHSLALTVKKVWDKTAVSDQMDIAFQKETYSFKPEATPFGFSVPVEIYKSEMNVIVLNRTHAFLTMPGELSCIYDRRLQEAGRAMGFAHVSVFGLTNDAHGYIILPVRGGIKQRNRGF